jgi:hypothetical protein
MPVEEINIGTLVARYNPVSYKWIIGIIVDIQSKYGIVLPETCNYSIKWFDTGETVTNYSYRYISEMASNYSDNVFDKDNTFNFS